MLSVLPPIFILLGLLDVWVDRATMMKFTGKGSGLKGVLIAFLLGSAAAGPLYAAFPVAGVMLKKGSSLFNVFIFIGAWSTTKIRCSRSKGEHGADVYASAARLSIIASYDSMITERSRSKAQQEEIYQITNKRRLLDKIHRFFCWRGRYGKEIIRYRLF
jgi:hypothetical protein